MAGDKGKAVVPEGYQALLGDLKERIRAAQARAALSVNRELILLYWRIGQAIRERQETHGWGAQVINRLSADLRLAFPDMKGFSPRNLQYMRTFAGIYLTRLRLRPTSYMRRENLTQSQHVRPY